MSDFLTIKTTGPKPQNQDFLATRQLKGDEDNQHVEDTLNYMREDVAKGDKEAFKYLAYDRDPKKTGWVSGNKQFEDFPGQNKDLELAAGLTQKEFNNAISKNLLKLEQGKFADPATASAFVNEAAGKSVTSKVLLDRIKKDGSLETRNAFAHAVLADPKLDQDQKTKLIQDLTSPNQKNPNKLTMDYVVKTAPDQAMNGLTKLMARPVNPNMSEIVAQSTTPDTQMRAARGVLRNPNLSPTERNSVLSQMMENTSQQGFNSFVAKATEKERHVFSAVIAGDVSLQERAGRQLSPANQQKVADEMLKLPLPKSYTGAALSVMMHPANMRPEDKNAMIDHFQSTGRMIPFAETQVYMPVSRSLLPGLNAENSAALRQSFAYLEQKSATDPSVADPTKVGSSVQTGTEKSRTESTSKTIEDGKQSTHTVGGEVGAEGGVGIPLVAEGKVSVKASYSYAHTSSHSEATTQGQEQSYTETYSQNVDQGAKQAYNRDVKNWRESNAFLNAALDIDQWSANQGQKYAESYRNERDHLVPQWGTDKKF